MSKTAKEMWADAGFKFYNECPHLITYSNESFGTGDLGALKIDIYKDGSFYGYCVPSCEEDEAIEFTTPMMMALVQQLIEFEVLKGVIL